MLVLNRKKNQNTYIVLEGKVIARICVIGLGGNQVKLGFEADKAFTILRGELMPKDKEYINI